MSIEMGCQTTAKNSTRGERKIKPSGPIRQLADWEVLEVSEPWKGGVKKDISKGNPQGIDDGP